MDTPETRSRRLQPTTVMIVLVIAGSLAMLAWTAVSGARVGGDSGRYLAGGTALFSDEEMPGRAGPYLGYIVVVGVLQQLGLGTAAIAVVQILVAAVAAIATYDLGRRLSGPWSGVLAVAVLVTFFSLVRWHRYVLTDSLAISLTMIGLWLVVKASSTRDPRWWAAMAFVLVWGAMVRPSGFVVLTVAAVWLVVQHLPAVLPRIAGIVGVLVVLAVVVPLTPSFTVSVDVETPAEQLAEGRVIWGAENTYRPMPAAEVTEPGYRGFVAYALDHPVDTVAVMVRRVGWELIGVRPHYSRAHNLYLLTVLVPLYLLAVWGVVRHRRDPVTWLLVGAFVGNLGLVALTFADWDSRFLMYPLPAVMVLAGGGAMDLVDRVRARGT